MTVAAAHGRTPDRTTELPLAYRGDTVGRLVLPADGLRTLLSSRDRALLVDVGRQAAVAVRSSRLARELQDSREQLVRAREEDRRRIRRDLHDGLGPALSGVAMRLDLAGVVLPTDPDRSTELIGRSAAELRDAVADVRRLVHDLRPPALDDLGLAGAIRQLAEQAYGTVQVTVTAADLSALPAAIEVAAYRIVAEAVTNTVRHAGAQRCTIEVRRGADALRVTVRDDGRGIDVDAPAGVGLRSMRERVAELGGRADITCPSEGGTLVTAELPFDGPTGQP